MSDGPDPVREDAAGGADGGGAVEHDLVDWGGTGRRMRRSGAVVAVLVLAGWLVTGVLGAGLTVRSLAGWVGLGLGLLFLAEVVVVGGAAVRGMLRAGERGERLAGGDVGILPTRRRRPRDEG